MIVRNIFIYAVLAILVVATDCSSRGEATPVAVDQAMPAPLSATPMRISTLEATIEGTFTRDLPAEQFILSLKQGEQLQKEMPVTASPPSAETPGETAASDPARVELGRFVGFDILLPTGSTVEAIVGANVLVAITPYTLDEAARFVEQSMLGGGYTLVTKVGPATGQATDQGDDQAHDQIAYLFQNGARVVNVTIVPEGDRETRIHFAASR